MIPPNLIPLSAAAEHPAIQISLQALHKRVQRGHLPALLALALERRGGRWFFRREELDRMQPGEVWL